MFAITFPQRNMAESLCGNLVIGINFPSIAKVTFSEMKSTMLAERRVNLVNKMQVK